MKIAVQNSFLKFYVMISTQVDLFGICHVKIHFIAHQKMYVMPRLGSFVWTTFFVQCEQEYLSTNFKLDGHFVEWKLLLKLLIQKTLDSLDPFDPLDLLDSWTPCPCVLGREGVEDSLPFKSVENAEKCIFIIRWAFHSGVFPITCLHIRHGSNFYHQTTVTI